MANKPFRRAHARAKIKTGTQDRKMPKVRTRKDARRRAIHAKRRASGR